MQRPKPPILEAATSYVLLRALIIHAQSYCSLLGWLSLGGLFFFSNFFFKGNKRAVDVERGEAGGGTRKNEWWQGKSDIWI